MPKWFIVAAQWKLPSDSRAEFASVAQVMDVSHADLLCPSSHASVLPRMEYVRGYLIQPLQSIALHVFLVTFFQARSFYSQVRARCPRHFHGYWEYCGKELISALCLRLIKYINMNCYSLSSSAKVFIKP